MGYDVGACGAFGIRLSEWTDRPEIASLIDALNTQGEADMADEENENYGDDNTIMDDLGAKYTDEAITLFQVCGIHVPDTAQLFWTGSDDSRPFRTDTEAGDWVIGFGLFTNPWDFPSMDTSFKKHAKWHTWVWGG